MLPDIEAKPEPLVFTELRSCCGTLYGYMDQHGREYDLEKNLKAPKSRHAILRFHFNSAAGVSPWPTPR